MKVYTALKAQLESDVAEKVSFIYVLWAYWHVIRPYLIDFMLRGPYRPKNFELAKKKKKLWSKGLVFGKGRQRKTNAVSYVKSLFSYGC